MDGQAGGAPTATAFFEQLPSQTSSAEQRTGLMLECFTKCLRFGLREPSMQDMAAFFPGLPSPVLSAILDLHRQVLTHIEAHSQVHGLHMDHWKPS